MLNGSNCILRNPKMSATNGVPQSYKDRIYKDQTYEDQGHKKKSYTGSNSKESRRRSQSVSKTGQGKILMSTASVKSFDPEPAHRYLVRRTVEACALAKEAAGAAAEGIATGSSTLLNSLRQRERDLDTLDMEIDSGVTTAITEGGVGPAEARELLACMKFMIGLERIGDLLLSFANSAQAAGGRLDSEDTRDLTQMATILEKMLTDVGSAFSQREVNTAVDVLRADAEMDRLRNLIFLRHIENPENIARQGSLQVIFMTQSLERAGDHAKNLAEEVCHFVSGHTVRHVLMAYDKPVEQMFIDWLRRRDQHH
jgi:phosphate transport system protein